MRELVDFLLSRKTGAPLVVAINGIDASGKTTFTGHLRDVLAERGNRVQVIHLDDYHLPRSLRRACTAPPPICYYRQTFDWERFTRLLRSVRQGNLELSETVLDLETDNYTVECSYEVDAETIVLAEGVFLLQPDLLSLYDLTIFLEITEEECLQRVTRRDGYLFGDEAAIRERYLEKYLPGQALYLAEANPARVADVVIDNNRPESPYWRVDRTHWRRDPLS